MLNISSDGRVTSAVGRPAQLTVDFDGGLDETDTAGPYAI